MSATLVLILVVIGAYLAAHVMFEWIARRFLIRRWRRVPSPRDPARTSRHWSHWHIGRKQLRPHYDSGPWWFGLAGPYWLAHSGDASPAKCPFPRRYSRSDAGLGDRLWRDDSGPRAVVRDVGSTSRHIGCGLRDRRDSIGTLRGHPRRLASPSSGRCDGPAHRYRLGERRCGDYCVRISCAWFECRPLRRSGCYQNRRSRRVYSVGVAGTALRSGWFLTASAPRRAPPISPARENGGYGSRVAHPGSLIDIRWTQNGISS